MKAKKSAHNKKQTIVVKDLNARKNPKGGASDIFAKIGDIKGESMDAKHSIGTQSFGLLNIASFAKGIKKG